MWNEQQLLQGNCVCQVLVNAAFTCTDVFLLWPLVRHWKVFYQNQKCSLWLIGEFITVTFLTFVWKCNVLWRGIKQSDPE